uniref:Uncharacterized protein n=1 Tax=Anguilla anguilla TaxID=7936 RepID=A0A0E9XLC4_ANGAN
MKHLHNTFVNNWLSLSNGRPKLLSDSCNNVILYH